MTEVLGTRRYAPELAALGARVEAALPAVLDRELVDAPEAVAGPVRYAVLGSGKRLRPLLVLAAWRAVGAEESSGPPEGDPAAVLACSVELVHAYSLVHDDLPCMDDDVLRRGRPTVHVRFGTPAAVLAGAGLMPMAARTLWRGARELGLGEARARRLLSILSGAAGARGMVGGQLLDLRAEGRATSREELESIHRGKTAALIAASVLLGAVAGRAGEEVVERLGRFGVALGLAFQAVDDILDVQGEEAEIGKTSGRDIALGKATYPSVMGLQAAVRVSRELAGEARRELAEAARLDLAGPAGRRELALLAELVVERRR